MVESSGGSCRCACQDEFQEEQERSSGCCSPHVFTSVLLGILSCVLMTGGVFLAFHKWDPMWLMVSGVGVVLILIGTILHCCNNMPQRPKRHMSAGKGCCPRPVPPDHSGHVIHNNGSLTEQLLPLSNARSVSQLSLNMLPGYFPPVVTAYGIEQHSAVVQNINRLVQQQQQQQQQQQVQQQPQSPVSISPSVVGSTAGKSFIVLSLPGDASAANIQNLVATVYQLDGNTVEATENETTQTTTPAVVCVKPNPPAPVILKNVEVQTCSIWPNNASSAVASTSGEHAGTSHSTPTPDSCTQGTAQPVLSSANCNSTQTENILPISEHINLMDCSTDIAPICDNSTNTCDNQTTDSNCALVNIPVSSSSSIDLLDASVTNSASNAESTSSVIIDISDAPSENISSSSTTTTTTTTDLLVDVVGESPSAHPDDQSEILINISENLNAGADSDDTSPLLENVVNNNLPEAEAVSNAINATVVSASEMPQTVPENRNSDLQNLNPDLLASTSNLSGADSDIDDGELMERSSPPPSYEDVTLEGENVGAFGLAYGTI